VCVCVRERERERERERMKTNSIMKAKVLCIKCWKWQFDYIIKGPFLSHFSVINICVCVCV
jgi:hypothetical protein